MTLADRCELVLLERGPLPAGELAGELRKRRQDVFAALHSDPRFAHTGKRKASRWSVRAGGGYTVEEWAARWGYDVATTRTFIFGPEGFLENGIVERVDGNGRVRPTGRAAAIFTGIEEAE